MLGACFGVYGYWACRLAKLDSLGKKACRSADLCFRIGASTAHVYVQHMCMCS